MKKVELIKPIEIEYECVYKRREIGALLELDDKTAQNLIDGRKAVEAKTTKRKG